MGGVRGGVLSVEGERGHKGGVWVGGMQRGLGGRELGSMLACCPSPVCVVSALDLTCPVLHCSLPPSCVYYPCVSG